MEHDMPLGPRDRAWDGDGARKRMLAAAGDLKEASAQKAYAKGFLWVDKAKPENEGSYKLPFADVMDGKLMMMPKGIMAAANVMQGGRGGVDIPESDVAAIKTHIAAMYDKMSREFGEKMTPPGEKHMAKGLPNVPILSTGTWKGNQLVKFDVADLAQMAANSGLKRQVPMKLGHAKQQIIDQKDGQPALGWLKNFRVIGNNLIADMENVPDVVHRAFAAGLWTQRSAELEWTEGAGWEVTGLALLGADLPAITDLPDIEQYLSVAPRLPASGEPVCLSWPKSKENPMPEDTKNLVQLQAEKAALQAEKDALQVELAKQQEQWRVAQFTAAKTIALQPIEKLIVEGRLEPKFRERVEAALEAQKATFAVGGQLTLPIDLSVELSTSAVLPKETGRHAKPVNGRADAALTAEVKKYMFEKNVSFEAATKAVLSVKPELAKSYQDAIPEIAREA